MNVIRGLCLGASLPWLAGMSWADAALLASPAGYVVLALLLAAAAWAVSSYAGYRRATLAAKIASSKARRAVEVLVREAAPPTHALDGLLIELSAGRITPKDFAERAPLELLRSDVDLARGVAALPADERLGRDLIDLGEQLVRAARSRTA